MKNYVLKFSENHIAGITTSPINFLHTVRNFVLSEKISYKGQKGNDGAKLMDDYIEKTPCYYFMKMLSDDLTDASVEIYEDGVFRLDCNQIEKN